MASCRMNYHEECELGVNKMINSEFYVAYTYLSMGHYFRRDDVALSNVSDWCFRHYEEEREHAQHLIEFQTNRGGRVQLNEIYAPEKQEFGSVLEAVTHVYEVERRHAQKAIDLHALAHKHHDGHMTDFLEGEFLPEGVEELKELTDLISNLKRVGPGLGEYMIDKDTFPHVGELDHAPPQ